MTFPYAFIIASLLLTSAGNVGFNPPKITGTSDKNTKARLGGVMSCSDGETESRSIDHNENQTLSVYESVNSSGDSYLAATSVIKAGLHPYPVAGNEETWRSIIGWDLSVIPDGATICGVELQLQVTGLYDSEEEQREISIHAFPNPVPNDNLYKDDYDDISSDTKYVSLVKDADDDQGGLQYEFPAFTNASFDQDVQESLGDDYVAVGIKNATESSTSKFLELDRDHFSLTVTYVDDGGGTGDTLPAIVDANMNVSGTVAVNGTIVKNGATLTIEPGATLEFASDSDLIVEPGGKIVADGTSSNPIVFDEKEEGQWWGGLIVRGSGSRFEHVEIRNGGRGPDSGDHTFTPRPVMQIEARNVKMADALIIDNAGVAIETGQTPNGSRSSFILTSSTIRRNGTGLYAFDTDATIHSNTISDHEYLGIYLIGVGTTASMQGNQIRDNGLEGVNIYNATVDHFKHNTIEGNGQYGLDVGLGAYVYLGGDSQNRIFNNEYHEVQTDSGLELDLGDASIGEGGYNEIYDTAEGYGSGHRYVKNRGTQTVKAEMNDWKGPNNSPVSSAMFDGPVDYDPYVTVPLYTSLHCSLGAFGDMYNCSVNAGGGDGGYDFDWSDDSCDGSFSCSVPCDSYVSVSVTSASGETASASTTTGECSSDDCDDGTILCENPPSFPQPYATLDEEELQSEIDIMSASLQSSGGNASVQTALSQTSNMGARADSRVWRGAEPAQRLQRLYRLLLLQSRVKQTRRGQHPPQVGALAGSGSESRALFTRYTDDTETTLSVNTETRNAALRLLVDDLLRSGRPDEALSSAREYSTGLSTAKARARMHLQRARAFQQKEQFEQALRAVDAAEEQWPERSFASLRMALLRRSGNPRWREIAEKRKRAASREASATSSAATSLTATQQARADGSLPQKFALDAPYPNPASGRATLPLALPERAEVRAGIYDVLGRRVRSLPARPLTAGHQGLSLSTAAFSSGLYLIRVNVEAASGETHTFTESITVVR